MNIQFKNKKIAKVFSESSQLVKTHGNDRAKKIRIRFKELRAATSLMDFWPPKSPPGRCHELTEGKRSGQLSVDLDHPYRLIFKPAHDPVPVKEDGGLDWSRVTAIMIIGVEDTHGKGANK
ncbi:type II toxin-antitoxin system RelE/ParE family toxin [Desulfatibacillum aliphaticivorans]|uniref:type II toxin-antitoxin system RelE/ParE family toxin n=1 Tax=Desulfatibacillum aliphaticivorans TaxID=218208 RepID=UPI0004823545|nr:killer suppression protein [Desulfatibacillum aliphaticivorans]